MANENTNKKPPGPADREKGAASPADHTPGSLGKNDKADPNTPDKQQLKKLNEISSKIGDVADFVNYVRAIEESIPCSTDRTADFLKAMTSDGLDDFSSTKSATSKRSVRYLALQEGNANLVDFRHFFRAAVITYSPEKLPANVKLVAGGGTYGSTLLLGLGNEVGQCVQELWEGASFKAGFMGVHFEYQNKLNSCFGPEDLGSNRLGASFASKVKESVKAQKFTPVYEQLESFLSALSPVPASEVVADASRIQLANSATTRSEAIHAFLWGIFFSDKD
jgi:hypothetical protein